MKKTVILSTLIFGLFSFNSVFAQTTSTTTKMPPSLTDYLLKNLPPVATSTTTWVATSTKNLIISTVNILDAKILVQNKRDFTLFFNISNRF
jgi:hypothetical protein